MNDVAVSRSFLRAAGRFGAQDRARIFDFVGKFYENPTRPGTNLEVVKGARDPEIRSARVTQSIRAIVHRSDEASVLLYVGEHDEAYRWAVQRTVTRHPVTRDVQIVAETEAVQSAIAAVEVPARLTPLFADHDDAYLLSLGVPPDWLPAVRAIRDDDQLLAAAEQNPETEEVWERLMRLASGEVVVPPSPDGRQRAARSARQFHVISDADELRELLERPLEDWIRFLHPSQRELAAGSFSGPVKVTGSAGTGKTVVALHRAAHLARQGKQVLLTSFVTTLCKNLERNLALLLKPAEARHVTVSTVHKQALALAREADRRVSPCTDAEIRELLGRYERQAGSRFDAAFLQAEWRGVIQPQGMSRGRSTVAPTVRAGAPR